jgi:enoyl-CoA hydratase
VLTDCYERFSDLNVTRRAHGVVVIAMDRPDQRNAMNRRMHTELTQIWRAFDEDPTARVAVLRGNGRAFSAGGDFESIEAIASDPLERTRMLHETRDLVQNIVNCSKPTISAMHGVAIGAGLVVGLLADISIATPTTRIMDGHTRIGVVAGDHAALAWPLLCGMARAKFLLLSSVGISGEEAHRIGLVSLCVPEESLLDTAFEHAEALALGSQEAIRGTKQALNNWYRSLSPIFEAALGLEFVSFAGSDVHEGLAALREHRSPVFES